MKMGMDIISRNVRVKLQQCGAISNSGWHAIRRKLENSISIISNTIGAI